MVLTSPAPARRSSRKRARSTPDPTLEVVSDGIDAQADPGASVGRKRRACEQPDKCTPVRDSRTRRSTAGLTASATQDRDNSDFSQVRPSTNSTTRAVPTSTDNLTWTYADPHVPGCCSKCHVRGANYGYTCIFEGGSDRCKRCIKEKNKCRPPTAFEVARSMARCQQCKARGLSNCEYEAGNTSCKQCIYRGKTCGETIKRKFTAHTRAFLGLNTPEPEHDMEAMHEEVNVNDTKQREATNDLRAQRVSRRSIAVRIPKSEVVPSNVASDEGISMLGDREARCVSSCTLVNDRVVASSRRSSRKSTQPASDASEDEASKSSRRPSSGPSPHDMMGASDIAPQRAAALLNSALVRGPARTSMRNNIAASRLTIQEATPNDSAAEDGAQLSEVDVDIGDDESADLQLIAESNNAAPFYPVTDTPINLSDDSDDSNTQHRVPLVDSETPRPRRGRARPSYIELIPSDAFEQESTEDDDEKWESSSADDESEIDDDDELVASESSAAEDEDEEIDAMDIEPEPEPKPTAPSRRKSQASSAPKQGKGLDLNLPPMNNIKTIAEDMASKAVKLGLGDALRKLAGRPINVATMCSGTESPLLFLQLLTEALDAQGEVALNIKHHFSAEIDATKQAYIERNFHPRLLFRDVRQLGDETCFTATTAYGAEEEIPGKLDIIVVGFICKDLSSLNNRKKTVDDQGETGDTWRAIYYYVKRFQPSIVLLENVRSDKSTWNDVVSRWSKIGYEATWVYCDTKNYYLPQTRERMYMIAINRKLYGKNVGEAASQWVSTMEKMQRQCSSPYEAFFVDLPATVISHSTLSSEPEWSLAKLRYDQIRSEQRLGIRRPLTRWSENGTLRPPDFANRKWYESQSSRVYDAIEVAHLQAAQEGYDSMYKMAIWDVSQNVDRFKSGMGLVPCITPGGCDFGSNRQDALNGSQTLVLQGMPLHKLHFAGETQRECQDLAGNAMSTTVIGASLIAALIHGSKAFRTTSTTDLSEPTPTSRSMMENRLVRASAMATHKPRSANREDFDVTELLDEARLASQLCACEGSQKTTDVNIKVCSACGHTACSTCASNPRHQYANIIARNVRKYTPNEFIRRWKPQLPSRLGLRDFPKMNKILSQLRKDKNSNAAYVSRIIQVDIGSRNFSLSEFVRCEQGWKVLYLSKEVRLELCLGDRAQWLLYVDCSPELPGNSALRKLLETPIARAIIEDSLVDAEWEMFTPSDQDTLLYIRGSTERLPSWRNKLGLPDYDAETVPARIHIRDARDDDEGPGVLEGSYVHLPHCGTAESSLYKKTTEPTLYLFLDPNPIGDVGGDSFVFSRDCSRKNYGQSRMIVTRLDPGWRPWQMSNEDEHVVNAKHAGSWITGSPRLTTSTLAAAADVLMPGVPLTGLDDECTNAVTILDVQVPESLPIQNFSDYSWALEQVKAAPSLEDWQVIDASTHDVCACAPVYPDLLWSVDAAGKATPQEDRKAAATFERAIKTRCRVFHVQPTVSKQQTRIEIGINIPSLVHRARGRLASALHSNEPVTSAWRLSTDHTDLEFARFPKFRLRSNAADSAFSGPLGLAHDLRGAQPRSLSWMRAQETGTSMTITEVEEAVHPGLGWRAEAHAQTLVKVRGGVLADLPSFGKTVTTIALIQSEFEEYLPEDLLVQNQRIAGGMPPLIDTAATLIVCPPHIAIQWQTELKLFLGEDQYAEFDVRIVKDFAELRSLTIDDLQHSKVVVVSWTIFADDAYISELAWLTGMPEPANSSCRAFEAWMDGVVRELPAQVSNLQSMTMSDFKDATMELLEQRLQQPEFQASLPLKLQHGSAYQAYEAVKASAGQNRLKAKPSMKRKSSASGGKAVPLLHMFRFNRIVVDEYHYLNDHKKIKNMFTAVSVKKIAAHKRWILSGTPALANFTDIDNIASFLGVRLGRFAIGAGKLTQLEQFLVSDQTAVERFLSKTEVMSSQWHQARHARAQEFLDLFVRQNEASLEHIPCHEELRAVDLDVAHHAVYLELSQHLISQRMQVKRLKNKAESDKTSRLNASLNNSKTAEDALLKAALLYETKEGESGLDSLVQKRSEQRRETEHEISRLIRAFEGHKRAGFKGLKPTDQKKADKEENTVPKLYASFVQDIKKNVWLGDSDATANAKHLLMKAEAKPTPGGFEELKEVSAEKKVREAKTIMSHLRDSCIELALRTRSERFITTVQQLLDPLCEGSQELISCDAPHCQREATVCELYLASQCGHLTCEPCMSLRGDDENCVVPGCSCTVQAVNLIKATDLGTTRERVAGHSYGRKTNHITKLIKRLPSDDQGLIFAPNDETISILGRVLDEHEILYYTPSGCNSRQAAKIIEEFKASKDEDPEDRPKVLLLNLTSETAAGVNLTNANHIIFISPLLVESQYKYDSAMTQAIARSRRYGQEKKVHIYHFAALRTIDVDILEHRHKRTDGITGARSTICMPPNPPANREKTKLVKNKQGAMALVPVSWVADEKARRGLGVEDEPETFTSLINFSETFEDGDE